MNNIVGSRLGTAKASQKCEPKLLRHTLKAGLRSDKVNANSTKHVDKKYYCMHDNVSKNSPRQINM